ncbi:MAG: hypothetical protein ACI8WT_003799 [Clostridium sp.]|jgi:hypothetical protein
MKKNLKTFILSILIILTTFIIIRLSTKLYLEFKNINLPTKESRQIGNMSTHKWVTVKILSEKFNISEDEIFKTLEIISQSGDENLNIKELGKKYNKEAKEMDNNLKKMMEKYNNLQDNNKIENDKKIEGKKI